MAEEIQGALFEEEKVEGKSPYKDLLIGDAKNGEVWFFYYDNKTSATSKEYGEFTILQGVAFNGSLKTIETIAESAYLASLIPNTLLLNVMKQGGLVRGEAYKVVKKWSKGDGYDDKDPKKKAKGHGFEVFRLKTSDTLLDALKSKHDTLLPEGLRVEGSPVGTSANVSTEKIDV